MQRPLGTRGECRCLAAKMRSKRPERIAGASSGGSIAPKPSRWPILADLRHSRATVTRPDRATTTPWTPRPRKWRMVIRKWQWPQPRWPVPSWRATMPCPQRAGCEAMKKRSRASSKPAKARPRKALKRGGRSASKAGPHRGSIRAGQDKEVAWLTSELNCVS